MTPEELIEEAAGRLREYGYGDLADGIEDLFEAGILEEVLSDTLIASRTDMLSEAITERDRLYSAIEEAKKFLTDVRETSEMRNRNAYGALKGKN